MSEMKPDMTVQFDPLAFYIKLGDGKVERTVEALEYKVLIDYDKDGNAVGVEVLP